MCRMFVHSCMCMRMCAAWKNMVTMVMVRTCVCMYVCVCVCTCVCMYVFMYVHIGTYTHQLYNSCVHLWCPVPDLHHQESQHSFLAHLFSELATRKYLDKYLASAFSLSLEGGKLKAVDDHMYVLTLDYTLKVCVHCTSVSTCNRTSCGSALQYIAIIFAIKVHNKWEFSRFSHSKKDCFLLKCVSQTV